MDTIDHVLLPLSIRLHLPLARRSLAAALLLLACGSPARAERNGPFLRTADARLAAALVRGRDESPTFRAIVDRLAASDLIVYVSRGAIYGDIAASTQLVSATGGFRYVRVTLELDPDSDVGVAMLGHELRHALELADAPWVVDKDALLSLYQEIGYASCSRPIHCYDTREAVDAGRQVLIELRHHSIRPPGGRAIERCSSEAEPSCASVRGGASLDALGLPVAFRKEPGADDGQRDERHAYRNERPGRAEAGGAGQKPGEGDLP
jgi:hypothetical protein